MKKRFTIARDGGLYAKGIRYGRRWVLHLWEGTQVNERYVRWLVRRLNGATEEPPELPNEFRSHEKR